MFVSCYIQHAPLDSCSSHTVADSIISPYPPEKTSITSHSTSNMTYKDLVDQLSTDLNTANQQIATLRRELADCSERLHAATSSGTQAPSQSFQQCLAAMPSRFQQELHRKLQHKIAEKAEEANRTVANSLAKSEGLEKELEREKQVSQRLRNLLKGKEEQLRNMQILRGSDLAVGPREAKLRQESTTLRGENARLKLTVERMQRQLQAEKSDNVSQLPYMTSSKDMDVDDEEPIPVYVRPTSERRPGSY